MKNVFSFMRALAIVIVATLSASWAWAQGSGTVYGNGQTQSMGNVDQGIVLQVSLKKTEASWQTKTAATAGGGLLGGLLTNSIAGNGDAKWAANALGALAGGYAADRIVNSVGNDAQELIIGLKDGRGEVTRVVTIVQPSPYEQLAQGESVLVLNTSGTIRVIRKNY